MICDYQTNKVYLAEGIKGYPKVAENLLMALCDEGIDTDYLPQTKSKKHVWARDYMPIQLEDNCFLQYIYNPDYLRGAPDYIPQYHSICRNLKLNCRKAMYIIDGGNVVKFEDCVLMTDKDGYPLSPVERHSTYLYEALFMHHSLSGFSVKWHDYLALEWLPKEPFSGVRVNVCKYNDEVPENTSPAKLNKPFVQDPRKWAFSIEPVFSRRPPL